MLIDNKIIDVQRNTFISERFNYTDALILNYLHIYINNTALCNATVITHHL